MKQNFRIYLIINDMKGYLRIWIYTTVLIGTFFMLTNRCKDNDPIIKDLVPVYGEPVIDIEGNVYKTVIIGDQVWMAENLKTTKYRNGESIPEVMDSIEWSKLTTGARCYYKNDTVNGNIYGCLYNWYVGTDSRNIAPIGWHVPDYAECKRLISYIQSHQTDTYNTVRSLASATDDWVPYKSYYPTRDKYVLSNDFTKNNSSGFTGLPSGYRYQNGWFINKGWTGIWWNSSIIDGGPNGYNICISVEGYGPLGFAEKVCGLPIRCVKD